MEHDLQGTFERTLDSRSTWRYRLYFGGLAGLALVLLSFTRQAASSNAQAVVETHKLVLLDPAGKRRAMLFTGPDGSPILTMTDAEGEARLLMTVGQNGTPIIALQDKAEVVRAMVTVDAGQASLSLHDPTGAQRGKLYVSNDASSALALWDKVARGDRAKPRALLTVSRDGSPRLALTNNQANPAVALGAVADEYSLAFFDARGEPRAGITMKADGTPRMSLEGASGDTLWKAP